VAAFTFAYCAVNFVDDVEEELDDGHALERDAAHVLENKTKNFLSCGKLFASSTVYSPICSV
jgi:hypothetical protein